jgi:GT2 family glycosyltransferase
MNQGARFQSLEAKVQDVLAREGDLCQTIGNLRKQVRRSDDEILARLDELEGNRGMSPRIESRQLVRRIRKVVRDALPLDATVLVVTNGDQHLLDLDVRRTWHFPQQSPQTALPDASPGTWAAYNHLTTTVGIAQLEMLRSRGANYLLFPKTALGWLANYAAFERYLNSRYKVAVREDDICVIYSLAPQKTSAETQDGPVWAEFDAMFSEFEDRCDDGPTVLNWNTGIELASRFPQYSIFSPPESGGTLPYIDQSLDIVVLATHDSRAVAEAGRVARRAVAILPTGECAARPASGLDVAWKPGKIKAALPSASIVIPSYNGIHFLEPCILALFETLPKHCMAEVIVVDDASTDDSAARLALLAERDSRLQIIRNKINSGFIDACNRGAAEATADVIIFLNNDTIPLPGWLPPLLRLLRDQKDCGAVGGKLLFPNGRMQEAGGIVFRDGTGANFGKWDDPEDPLFNYVREVDYCSGALLATWRSLFLELGGLDTLYRPMYYDDSDFCFRVRAKGLKVYYQPASAIIHIEGGSSGTDENQSYKRYQGINRGKFIEKWALAMKRQPVNPQRIDRASLHRMAIREEYDEQSEGRINGRKTRQGEG